MKRTFAFLTCLVLGLVQMLGASIPTGALYATSISLTALRTAYGSYYADGSANMTNLYRKMFLSSSFDELFTVRRTKTLKLRFAGFDIDNVIQPFQLAYTDTGSISVTPSEIDLRMIKSDLLISSYNVYNDYIGFLHEQGKDQQSQPYVAFLLENVVAPRYADNWERLVAYSGAYAAPTPGTAGAPGTAINGVKTIINTAITNSTITALPLGAVPSDNELYVDYIEAAAELIDVADRDTPMTIAVSKADHTRFMAGMRSKYNLNYAAADLSKVYLHQNLTVKGYAAMGNSRKFWATPVGNAVKAVNMSPDGEALWRFQEEDRSLKVFSDHAVGLGFIDHSRVYTNPEDLS